MKMLKINLALLAVVLGASMAFAFKAPAKTRFTQIEWVRTGTAGSTEGNTWVKQSSGACDDADRICKAMFLSGYDPNAHTYLQNENAATVVEDNGYVPQ